MSLLHQIGSCEHNDPPKRPDPSLFLDLEGLIRLDNPDLTSAEVYATAQRLMAHPGMPGACVHRMPQGMSAFKNGRCVRCGSPSEAPGANPTLDLVSSVIELIYAGRPLTNHVRIPYGAVTGCSFCGAIAAQFENPANHTANCPLSRYFAAVEAVKKAVL